MSELEQENEELKKDKEERDNAIVELCEEIDVREGVIIRD